MKKGFIALVVAMAGAIGVLGYFAYPQIKIHCNERHDSDRASFTKTSWATTHGDIRQKLLSQQIDINEGKTDIERTLIIKYNNLVTAVVELALKCMDNGINFLEIGDLNELPKMNNLPKSVEEKYKECIQADLDLSWFYEKNKNNVRRELLENISMTKNL